MTRVNVEVIQPKLLESGFEVSYSGCGLMDLEQPSCKLKFSTAIQGDTYAISQLCFKTIGLENRLVIFRRTHLSPHIGVKTRSTKTSLCLDLEVDLFRNLFTPPSGGA